VSNGVTTDYFSIDLFNARSYQQYGLSVYTTMGWESVEPNGGKKDDSITASIVLTRDF